MMKGTSPTAVSSPGLSTSAEYKTELNKWNYQQKVKADEMTDSINLVIDPRMRNDVRYDAIKVKNSYANERSSGRYA